MGQQPETDDRDTLVDAIDSSIGMLLSLPTRTFASGATILNTENLAGYYIVLTGKAVEYAISPEGQPDADRVELGPKDIIGHGNFIRVESITDMTVAIVNSEILARSTPTVRSKVADYLLEAARKRSTLERDRIIILASELAEQRSLVEMLESQADSLRLEFEAKLNAKTAEIENRIIDNTRLARRVKTLTRELDHKNRELDSAATILQLYKEEIDEVEETLNKRSHELSELRDELAGLSGLAPVLERMITSGNTEWASVAQKALTMLYAQGKGRLH